MIDVDYIIIGIGIAGISFCEQLKANNKSFIVFDNNVQSASMASSGLYNPIILKRFTAPWRHEKQLQLAHTFYSKIERTLKISFDHKKPIYRLFNSLEEQNNWFVASEKPLLSKFLSSNLITDEYPFINAPFNFGEVLHTGHIDMKRLIASYKSDLASKDIFFNTIFDYNACDISDKNIYYNNIKAKHIVFAEGCGIKNNPYFNTLPLKPLKGETLTIYAPDLNINFILKSGIFFIPTSNNNYIVGATYERENLNPSPSEKGREILLQKIKKTITCDFQIIDQSAGLRPTVFDRKPLVGRHHKHKNMYLINGLGSRGIMTGPYAAKQLYNYIEHDIDLEREIDVMRWRL